MTVESVFQTALKHPTAFAERIVGDKLSEQQKIFLTACFDSPYLAVKSGHSTGKTRAIALFALWWHYRYMPSIVITTAAVARQVRDTLWKEIRGAAARMQARLQIPLGGEILETRLKEDSADWYMLGFTADSALRFQSYHSPNLLVCVDEASGVDNEIYDGIEGLLTTANCKLILSGQPLGDRNNYFIRRFSDSLYKKITFSSLDSPFCSRGWIAARKAEWGEDSPIFRARVLGEIPTELDDSLIPLAWLERSYFSEHPEPFDAIGVDVAYKGADLTAFAIVKRGILERIETYSKIEPMEICGRIIRLMGEFAIGPDAVFIDDTGGYGSGVVSRLREQGHYVQAVNFGSKARDVKKFANARAEIFWNVRELVRKQKIRLPRDSFLEDDFAKIKAEVIRSDGKIRLKSKEQIKEELGRSPDRADALALACLACCESAGNYAPDVSGMVQFGVNELARSPQKTESGIKVSEGFDF